jgi:coenzyme F420-0:L-glutamate ligase/coenzyme F420-1:gamma-L-glutamate ligase
MVVVSGQEFWSFVDRLVASCSVIIDRPRGSRHPRYPDLVYPLDYGYLDKTTAVDGGGIDVWIGTLDEHTADALILTVDLKKQDAEIKILLGCSDADMQGILDFVNSSSMRGILIRRSLASPGQQLLHTRRSVRRFNERPVPRDVLERVLEAATWAPSAHNRQPWRFAALSGREAKTRLADAMGADFRRDLIADGLSPAEAGAQVERSRRRILEAPVAILICLDPSTMDEYPDAARQKAEYMMAVQSVAMAGENLLLAAHFEGLGGVWVCAPLFAPDTVRDCLDLPVEWQPQGLLLLGYPAKIPDPRPRLPVAEITRFL